MRLVQALVEFIFQSWRQKQPTFSRRRADRQWGPGKGKPEVAMGTKCVVSISNCTEIEYAQYKCPVNGSYHYFLPCIHGNFILPLALRALKGSIQQEGEPDQPDHSGHVIVKDDKSQP